MSIRNTRARLIPIATCDFIGKNRSLHLQRISSEISALGRTSRYRAVTRSARSSFNERTRFSVPRLPHTQSRQSVLREVGNFTDRSKDADPQLRRRHYGPINI